MKGGRPEIKAIFIWLSSITDYHQLYFIYIVFRFYSFDTFKYLHRYFPYLERILAHKNQRQEILTIHLESVYG